MKHFLFLIQLLALPCLFSFTKPATTVSKYDNRSQICTHEAKISHGTQIIGSNVVEVSWPQVSGVQSYLVVVTENGTLVHQSNAYGTSKMVNGLALGHTYHCTVVGMINGSQVTDYIIAMDIMP
jgi:hypothetical protein